MSHYVPGLGLRYAFMDFLILLFFFTFCICCQHSQLWLGISRNFPWKRGKRQAYPLIKSTSRPFFLLPINSFQWHERVFHFIETARDSEMMDSTNCYFKINLLILISTTILCLLWNEMNENLFYRKPEPWLGYDVVCVWWFSYYI